MPQAASSHIVVREHQPLDRLDRADLNDLKDFALANAEDDEGNPRSVLTLLNGQLHARNHVGVIETRGGTVVEILPKVEFDSDEDARKVFLKMLRPYRDHDARFVQFDQASIRSLSRFNMLQVFVRLFLDDLLRLTQRGLARHYQSVEDNLPCLRGRIQFAEHIRLNAANGARFYVAFDEFTADRPVNRLIHTTIHRLRAVAHPDHRQLLHQLRICFADVPLSTNPRADWERRRIDRSMRHYETVMAWVGLFLFNHGLATFAGEHVNRALLFPMEKVFEDFLVDAFRRHQNAYEVGAQKPQRPFAKRVALATSDESTTAFTMKPDIALVRRDNGRDNVSFVLDAKWKVIKDPKHDIVQSDVYQLYSYGRKYGCRTVALIYPRTAQFQNPLRYDFDDKVTGQPLSLWCFPFDVVHPRDSVQRILNHLG